MIKRLLFSVTILFVISCSNGEQEISLDKIPEDLKILANQNATNILNLCDDDLALKQFRDRSSPKMRLQTNAGKQMLTCMVYATKVSAINLGTLYKVNRVEGNVKRFKYKLAIESDTYDLMELHLDLNSKKFIANYSIYGKTGDGKWISLLDELENDARKFFNKMK